MVSLDGVTTKKNTVIRLIPPSTFPSINTLVKVLLPKHN
jgi:hypothetical protein